MITKKYNLKGEQPPPVEERPKCLQCKRRLRPNYHNIAISEKVSDLVWFYDKWWKGTYGANHDNCFCNNLCAWRYAIYTATCLGIRACDNLKKNKNEEYEQAVRTLRRSDGL